MYYAYKKNHILNTFFHFGKSMKKIMMVKEKKCFVECIQMEDLDAIFFNSRFF
jgi:hypothetical protein